MRLQLSLFLCLLVSPAFAAASDWQELAPGAKARLISADEVAADGSVQVGIEIDMPPELNTYWRVPGETGIPTVFDFRQSRGVGGFEVLWPYPEIDQSTGYVDYVYRGPTVLPIELTATGDPMDLDVTVVMGICSDICVPVEARFVLPVRLDKADTGQSLRLRQALADVPIPPEADAAIGPATLTGTGLSLPIDSPDVDLASLIVASDDPAILFGAPQKSPDNGGVIVPVLMGGGPSLAGQTVEISYMTPEGPFVVHREIVPAGSTPGAS
ncbi:MAG TPA: protein-disulfide reductase DsbD domain-containing protein [Devosia sp.]